MRVSLNRVLDRVVDRIEGATVLDPVADRVAGLVGLSARSPRLRSWLSGTDIGHPAHPALVAVPMGSWIAASYLDATAGPGGRRAAQALVGLGVVAAVPAAATGASDWFYTTGAERRVGFVHAVGNYVAVGLYAASWWSRRRDAAGAPLPPLPGWLPSRPPVGWVAI